MRTMSSAIGWIDARHAAGLIAGVVLLALQAGCTCKPGASHCDGDSLYQCQGSYDAPSSSWYVVRCAGACVSLDGASFCSTERAPSADCAAADNAEHCADNAVVSCHKGYRTATESCGIGTCVPAEDA